MPDEELVVVRSYQWCDEAKMAESVLLAEGIPCELYDEHLAMEGPLAVAMSGGIRLLVPVSRVREALAVLEVCTLSEEELAAQAEAAIPSDEEYSFCVVQPGTGPRLRQRARKGGTNRKAERRLWDFVFIINPLTAGLFCVGGGIASCQLPLESNTDWAAGWGMAFRLFRGK